MTSWKQAGGDPELIQSKVYPRGPPSGAGGEVLGDPAPLVLGWSTAPAMPPHSPLASDSHLVRKSVFVAIWEPREAQLVPWSGKMKEGRAQPQVTVKHKKPPR